MPETLRCCKCKVPLRSEIYGSYCEDCWADRAGNYPLRIVRPQTGPVAAEEPKGMTDDD